MRKHTKRRCAELIKTIEEAHAEIIKFIKGNDTTHATALLGDCQDAAVAIGNLIESSEGEGTEAVKLLEEYCESLYHVNEEVTSDQDVDQGTIEKRLKKALSRAESSINALPIRLEAVFLPYNVTMWDSLESIWMAADADENCDAYVVPIPYYDKNPDGSIAKVNYDIDKYPDYVPVINHEEFNLPEHHPDMIFFHNPYDNHNFVTSVHPAYYSDRLKEYTDCLVYVPYYATAGMMSEGQRYLPSYMNADYIVVQSKEIIEQFDKRIPREKFLPLGSPKFDRVIRLCNTPPEPPAEWKEKMAGRRVYFYNTSLGGMLDDTESWLKKLGYVFDTFKGVEDACLLWRPHPLLESSMESMRPEYREEYESLKKAFVEDGIGIFDTTPDIGVSIALSDAYIGDAGTSVISLFGVAGKPVYIMNNTFTEAPAEDDWKAWTRGTNRWDRYDHYSLMLGNRLFEKKDNEETYHYCAALPNEYSGGGYYRTVIKEAGKVIIFPANAENILIMDPESKSFHKIELKHEVGRDGAFVDAANLIFSEHPEVFYLLPNRYTSLVCFDAIKEVVNYIEDEAFSDEYSVYENELMERIISVRFFRVDDGPIADSPETENIPTIISRSSKTVTAPDGSTHKMHMVSCIEIPGITLKGPKLFCIDKTGTRMRAIQLETGEVQERRVSLNGMYRGALMDANEPNIFWFLPYRGTVLVKWNISDDTWEKVDAAVEGIVSVKRHQRYECEDYYFSNGIIYKGKLILAPHWGNKFVEIDTHTNEAKEWIPPFPYTIEDRSNYWKNGSIGYFYRDAYDYSVKFNYAPEHLIYDLDMDNRTATVKEFSFDRDEVFGLSMGFHRESQWLPYCLFEDIFNPLADFIRNEVHGAKFDRDIQLDTFKSINSSPAGDCGERVYQEVVDIIKYEK
ncbi:MAG: hypothetical protein IK152_08105 [Lachnospiraceae bacterium]|nr:hypothetical protein [Lachnospiraceae bacterium]